MTVEDRDWCRRRHADRQPQPGGGVHHVAGGGQRQRDGDVRRVDSTDEGAVCGSACTYQWDFGDFTTDTGKIVTHHWRHRGPTR
jgi:hypothetical protein